MWKNLKRVLTNNKSYIRMVLNIFLLAAAITIAGLVMSIPNANAHEGYGMWHRQTAIYDIIGARSSGPLGISKWYMDHGGPYINPDPKHPLKLKFDESFYVIFIHNVLHYSEPSLTYEGGGR